MICQLCGKRIEQGLFRYAMTYKGYEDHVYVCQHQECSKSDAGWVAYVATKHEAKRKMKERLKAFKEFKTKWDTIELDEDIEYMEESLKRIA